MRFIVWFEPERVEAGAEVAIEHPEWLLLPEDPAKGSRLFNLSIPEAAAWLFGKIAQIIDESGIDFYRQDFNIDPLPFWRRADEPDRRGLTEKQNMSKRCTRYGTTCAPASRACRSTTAPAAAAGSTWKPAGDPCRYGAAIPVAAHLHPSDRSCIWNQNQTLGLARYLAYQSIASWLPDTNEFRSAMTMGIAGDFDAFNPDFDFVQARASIDEIRSLQKDWEGDFYGLTEPSPDPTVWTAYQLHRADHGFALFFRRSSAEINKVFALRGLDPEKRYALTFSDEQRRQSNTCRTGRDLAAGMAVAIPAENASLLVRYRELT